MTVPHFCSKIAPPDSEFGANGGRGCSLVGEHVEYLVELPLFALESLLSAGVQSELLPHLGPCLDFLFNSIIWSVFSLPSSVFTLTSLIPSSTFTLIASLHV